MRMAAKLADELFTARIKLGYTQDEVAEAVSISTRWYQKIESGKTLPGAKTLVRLVLFLDIDIERLREEAGLIVLIRSVQGRVAFR